MAAVMTSDAIHAQRGYKIPESVLVLIHTAALDVLLLRRAQVEGEYWQSVTGSRKTLDEPLACTAVREVREETGLDAEAPGFELSDWGIEHSFEIYAHWRQRYAPGVTRNIEHVFALRVPGNASIPVQLNPREHVDSVWLPWDEAAERCFSWTNAKACRLLPAMVTAGTSS